jgi:hypothetical protein
LLDRQYFTRQAAMLLRWAKSIKDAQAAAFLIDKAAHLSSQAEQAREDIGPRAPDIQPEDFNITVPRPPR